MGTIEREQPCCPSKFECGKAGAFVAKTYVFIRFRGAKRMEASEVEESDVKESQFIVVVVMERVSNPK